MDITLRFVVIMVLLSTALKELARGVVSRETCVAALKKEVTRREDAEDYGIYRFVDLLWCALYLLAAWLILCR